MPWKVFAAEGTRGSKAQAAEHKDSSRRPDIHEAPLHSLRHSHCVPERTEKAARAAWQTPPLGTAQSGTPHAQWSAAWQAPPVRSHGQPYQGHSVTQLPRTTRSRTPRTRGPCPPNFKVHCPRSHHSETKSWQQPPASVESKTVPAVGIEAKDVAFLKGRGHEKQLNEYEKNGCKSTV